MITFSLGAAPQNRLFFLFFLMQRNCYGLRLGSPQALVQIRYPSASASSGLQEPEPHSGQPQGCCRLTLEGDLCTGEILRSFITSLRKKKISKMLKYLTQNSCPCLPGELSWIPGFLPTKCFTQILIDCLRQLQGRLSKWTPDPAELSEKLNVDSTQRKCTYKNSHCCS